MFRSSWLSRILTSFGIVFALGWGSLAIAQNGTKVSEDQDKKSAADQPKANKSVSADQSGDPLPRPLDEKRRKQNEKAFRKELKGEYRKWLDEDVRWIISDDERKAFMQLS